MVRLTTLIAVCLLTIWAIDTINASPINKNNKLEGTDKSNVLTEARQQTINTSGVQQVAAPAEDDDDDDDDDDDLDDALDAGIDDDDDDDDDDDTAADDDDDDDDDGDYIEGFLDDIIGDEDDADEDEEDEPAAAVQTPAASAVNNVQSTVSDSVPAQSNIVQQSDVLSDTDSQPIEDYQGENEPLGEDEQLAAQQQLTVGKDPTVEVGGVQQQQVVQTVANTASQASDDDDDDDDDDEDAVDTIEDALDAGDDDDDDDDDSVDDEDDDDDEDDLIGDDVIEARQLQPSKSDAESTDFLIKKYNPLIDGILSRMNLLIKRSYDPVIVDINAIRKAAAAAIGDKKSPIIKKPTKDVQLISGDSGKPNKQQIQSILFGLSSMRRRGNVIVTVKPKHTIVKSYFTLGPLYLRVERGNLLTPTDVQLERKANNGTHSNLIKQALAKTDEMIGRITIKFVNGVASLQSIKVQQPKNVSIERQSGVNGIK